MIIKNKSFHIIKISLILALFISTISISFLHESTSCMGIKIIFDDKYEELLSNNNIDIEFLFNNESAPVDKNNNIIYISRNISKDTKLSDIQGDLSSKDPSYQLYIKSNNGYSNPFDTMVNGGSYSLFAVSPYGEYKHYQIVFTSLPVINIAGTVTGIASNGTELYSGEITFSDPNSKETQRYRTLATDAQWHIRGNTTARQPKKPWKISLKDSKGQNKNLSFCGLGEDDDWILNPMNLDDLKIREKLIMDLWNQDDIFTSQGNFMSCGEYVEVVMDGEYQGLYLLQRRLDKKYLDLSDDDILIKSKNMATKTYVSSETVEIVYSPFTEQETYSYLKANFDGKYIPMSNIENWIEMTAFTQMSCGIDNIQSKNIVMLLKKDGSDKYTVNYILWDTDMSFGLCWSGGYVYDYDRTVFADAVRFEYENLTDIYPMLNENIATRWAELRNSIFSNESISKSINSLYQSITFSCSLQRDQKKWGLYYKGADNMNQLYTFIENRMEYLDDYYSGV